MDKDSIREVQMKGLTLGGGIATTKDKTNEILREVKTKWKPKNRVYQFSLNMGS